MAGQKGRSGGARPGAGRKCKDTEERQIKKRAILLEVVTDEDWRKVAMTALSRAKAGDKASRDWLTPWIMGKVPEEIKHSTDPDEPMRMVVELEYIDRASKS